MIGVIYLVIGLVLMGVGFLVYFSVSSSGIQQTVSQTGLNLGITLLMPSIILWIIGGIMLVFGLITLWRSQARTSDLKLIAFSGVETDAIITFLDRNYQLRVNNRPIYSIVEYRYRDTMGRELVNRASNISSEFIIRSSWQVGMIIKVRYLPNDPARSAIVAAELMQRR